MPSAKKKCICQLCTCGRHMCLHRNKESQLVHDESSVAGNRELLIEAREKRRKQWDLTSSDISTSVDHANAKQVLAEATAVTVNDKGNSTVSNNGNSWSAKQVPKRLLIRPSDNLKTGGAGDFTTIQQFDYTKKSSAAQSTQEFKEAEVKRESWNRKQIPKTLPIKNPDSLTLSGALNMETTSESVFNKTVFEKKEEPNETSHRPRTSLKLGGEFQSDSSYQRAFTPKHAAKVKKGTTVSHLKPEGEMSFDTTSLDYKAAIAEQARWESQNDIPLKPKQARPQSEIRMSEEPLRDETTAVMDYKRWNVEKPERHKPSDTWQLGDGTAEVDAVYSDLAKKVDSTEVHNADAVLHEARWQVSRPTAIKPQNNLTPEGNFNFETVNDVDYPNKRERSRYLQSNLETVTERKEHETLEKTVLTQNPEVSMSTDQADNAAQPMGSNAEAQIAKLQNDEKPSLQAIEAEQNTDRKEWGTDTRNEEMEYLTWDQVRPKPIRPHSNLRQEGEMEFDTTNRSEFIQKSSMRVKGIRPKTTTKVSDGNFDATTMNQIMFSHDQVEKVNPIRPKSNLHLDDGPFVDETTSAREYQQWQIQRPSPIVHKSNLTQEGSIDFVTTNRTEFEEKHPEKVFPIRPTTTNRISGDHDMTTTNQVTHSSFPIERVQKIIPEPNLRMSSGVFNSETTNKSQFKEYHVDRPKPIRPISNLRQEGSMDFTTMNQLQFEEKQAFQFHPHSSSKNPGQFNGTQIIRPKGNIELEKGTFANDTTNHSEFQQWQQTKPQLVTPRNNLQQEGDIDFTTTNQVQYATKAIQRTSQIRPKTNPKISGEFDGTTTNRTMYQGIAGETQKAVRPHTNITLERGNFNHETTNNREFQTWGYEKSTPIKPHSSIRQEGSMDFTTTNSLQYEGKPTEKSIQIRPTTAIKLTGDFDGTTMNQAMFLNNPVERVRGKRPSTNIHLESGRFEDQTTATREFQHWELARPEAIKPFSTLTQEGKMDFTTSNQTEFGEKAIARTEQIRPHTSSPITGDFDGTTTNQVMYQGQTMEKVHDIRPRDNIRIQSGEFNGESTTSKEYGYKTGSKQELIKPKPNITQEGNYDFVTSNQLEFEEKTAGKVSKIRPKTLTKMSEAKFSGTTTNQSMFQAPTVDTIRPSTHIRMEDGAYETNTTDAYQQWKTERPKAFQLASSLKQEGEMNFETTNHSEFREKSLERVQQIRPKTTTRIEGDFTATTTNQEMFHQPDQLDRVKPIRHQNNIYLESGKFENETTTNREYREWVKPENQIAVPKKKLQAAGIRTQREKTDRRKTVAGAKNDNSKENEPGSWKLKNKGVQLEDTSAQDELARPKEDVRKHEKAKTVRESGKAISKIQETENNKYSQNKRNETLCESDVNGQNEKTVESAEDTLPNENVKSGERKSLATSNKYNPQAEIPIDGKPISESSHETMAGKYESWKLSENDVVPRAESDGGKDASRKEDGPQDEGMTGRKKQNIPDLNKGKRRYKPHDNLTIEHVPFDGTSTSRSEYKKLEGRRSSSKRRRENLKQEGRMEFETTSNDYSATRDYKTNRQTNRAKAKTDLRGTLTQTGSMEFATTSKTSYSGPATASRTQNLRPRSSLRFDASYVPTQEGAVSSRSNPEIPSRDHYDRTSTSKASYVGHSTSRRTRANRPSTSQKVGEGTFEGQSTTRSSFTMPEDAAVKTRSMKPENHNILDCDNGMTGESTYKSSFETTKSHCPVIDLESGKSCFAFNEEKNGHLFYAPRVQG